MSKGGSTSSSVTVPDYIENAARRNLNKAEGISQIGYTPYFGPDVAALTPMQQASFQNTANVANAFGMGTPSSGFDIMGGMGEPTQYAGGVSGYSSAPIYEQSLDELAARRPAQKAYMDSFFIDPYTGMPGANVQSPNAMYPTYNETQAAAIQSMQDSRRDYRGDRNKQRMLDMMNREATSPFDPGSSTAGTNYAVYDQSQGFTAPGMFGAIQNMFDPKIPDATGSDYGLQNPNTTSIVAGGYDVGEVDPTLAMAAGYRLPIKGQPGNYDLFSGRGTDGRGKYGLLGDIGGAIGDATGFTSYNTPDVIQGRVDAEAARIASENAARTAPAAKKKKSTSSALKKEMAKAQANSRAQIDNERDSYY
tara:strand:- start:382 stop:1473 length:1092 start_codon:yes stop_codon:yes gene_type:complete